MKDLIHNNELQWLRSLNCTIINSPENIIIQSNHTSSTDFNFTIPLNSSFQNDTCYRVSEKYKIIDIKSEKYIMEEFFDINFIYYPEEIQDMFHFKIVEVEYESWSDSNESRLLSHNIHFYYIYYNNLKIGKLSTVEDEALIGIYDFEIIKSYRGIGIGTLFLREFSKTKSKIVFIQTWSGNKSAIKCYESAGFSSYEKLYRYVKTK